MRKGLWSPDEDERLVRAIRKYVNGSWSDIARKAGLDRCGKSCRRRWMNHLRPDLKHGKFSADEINHILRLHHTLGNRWSDIAKHLDGRTDNDVKNLWNTKLKKRLQTMHAQPQQHKLSPGQRLECAAAAVAAAFAPVDGSCVSDPTQQQQQQKLYISVDIDRPPLTNAANIESTAPILCPSTTTSITDACGVVDDVDDECATIMRCYMESLATTSAASGDGGTIMMNDMIIAHPEIAVLDPIAHGVDVDQAIYNYSVDDASSSSSLPVIPSTTSLMNSNSRCSSSSLAYCSGGGASLMDVVIAHGFAASDASPSISTNPPVHMMSYGEGDVGEYNNNNNNNNYTGTATVGHIHPSIHAAVNGYGQQQQIIQRRSSAEVHANVGVNVNVHPRLRSSSGQLDSSMALPRPDHHHHYYRAAASTIFPPVCPPYAYGGAVPHGFPYGELLPHTPYP